MSRALTEPQRELLDRTLEKHGLVTPAGVTVTPSGVTHAGAALSVREREVVVAIADGLGNRQTAERMTISEETVKTHVRHILSKLEANNRAHAVAIAFKTGLLTP